MCGRVFQLLHALEEVVEDSAESLARHVQAATEFELDIHDAFM
jgi:hypothetical protein